MTIDTTTIKAGDKLHLRDGSVLVAHECDDFVSVLHRAINLDWHADGRRRGHYGGRPQPLDIIRIEPKPEPVVETCLVGKRNGRLIVLYNQDDLVMAERPIYKLTFTDGEPSIERVR